MSRFRIIAFMALLIAGSVKFFTMAESRIVTDYYFSHIKSADGLSHQQIGAMVFDRDGRLWIGTRDGLGCYDGYSFRNYYHRAGDESSLIHNFVKVLFVDSKGNLWVGTEAGLCRYVSETDSFIHSGVAERIKSVDEIDNGRILVSGDGLMIIDRAGHIEYLPHQDDGYVVGVAIAPDKRVFVATNKTIAYYDSKMRNCTFVNPDVYSDFLMGFDDIVPMFFDHAGLLWIGRSGKGVMSYDIRTGKSVVYDVPLLTNGTVRAISEDCDNNIWAGTENGLNIINPSTGNVISFKSEFAGINGLNDKSIYCIVPDEDNNMWIGTYFGGINVVHRGNNNFRRIAAGNGVSQLRGKVIRRIVEPVKGSLWLATEDGGINTFDIHTGIVTPFLKIPSLGNNVHELCYDKEYGKMWIGTFLNGLFCYDMRNGSVRQFRAGLSGLGSNAVFDIVKQTVDGLSRLWIATTQGLRYYDYKTESFRKINHPILDRDFVYCLLTDSKGRLWVGTVNSGLYRVDSPTDVKGWSFTDTPGITGLHDRYVTELYEGEDGRVYVGTNNAGLHVVDKDGGISLLSDVARNFGTICSMIRDKKGMLWVSTSRGLYRYDSKTGNTERFTVDDGLPENQFNFSSALLASDGQIYMGTVNGLVSFSPGISRTAAKPAVVHLDKLFLSNQEMLPGVEDSPLDSRMDYTEMLVLPYGRSRSFSIDYGVVSPASARTYMYQVQLEGVDNTWRDVGTQRQFSAMDFAPGTYKLKIRASATPDGWEAAPVRELLIKIDPPFYLSAWAFIVYFILAVIAAYLFWRLFSIRIKEREAVKMSKMEKEKSEELNREKMELFTNISHELKTPLSLILAPLKYLSQHEELDSDSEKRLNMAITNTNKMVGLIDELVTFNRVESGNFQLFLQYGDPLEFMTTMTQYFKEAAQEKNISITIYTEDNGEKVWFSTAYLERILNNLLSNAIKYTQEGGKIEVRASIQEENESLYLCFSVSDNGIGIVESELENIFRKYYQTRRGYDTNHQGWGIGLATVKRLVENQKGSISVNSVMGEGSVFTVKLNVSADAFPQTCYANNGDGNDSPIAPPFINTMSGGMDRSEMPVAESSSDNRVSILLVEDNPELLQFLSDSYSSVYRVYAATNGEEALKILGQYPVDIVVSDVMMPVMDGITLCCRIKGNHELSHIPVILLTAKNDTESTVRGFESGAEAYVTKPFDPQILELRIRNILRSRRRFLNEVMESDGNTDVAGEDVPVLNDFDKRFISNINALVDENIDNSEFAIADITKKLGISRSLLHIKMKSFFNKSMTDFIKMKRMSHACKLLREGFNVSETAYRCGYSDPNYFTKVFKKELGMTPSEYAASPEETQ